MADENKGDDQAAKPTLDSTPAEPAEPAEASAEATKAADADDEPAAADGGEADAPGPKSANPAAILARVQNLGEEDELERVARQEEEKLAERRAAKKRSRLEDAASKKLDKIGTKPKKKKRPIAEDEEARAVARPQGDALYLRTMTLGEWISKNAKGVAAVVAAAAVVGAGVFGYFSYQTKKNTDASRILIEATADANGRIGTGKKDDDAPADPRPEFATTEARDSAALDKYRKVVAQYKGTGPAILARLAEGALLLDKRDADGAIAAFEEVRSSALAQVDTEVRGRALESLGFAYELKGNLDEAAKTYRDLENNVDVRGFKELALYHQARVAEAKGDKDKAKELYKTAFSRVSDEMNKAPFPYLREAIEDRLRTLDPSALPAKSPFNMGGGPSKMNEAQLRQIQEQIRKQMEEAQKKQQQNPGQTPP